MDLLKKKEMTQAGTERKRKRKQNKVFYLIIDLKFSFFMTTELVCQFCDLYKIKKLISCFKEFSVRCLFL